MAGTAQLRDLLGAQAADWVPEERYGSSAHQRPDAVWHPGQQAIAVEYDSGYPPMVIREKLRAFAGFDEIVWGTPSTVRTAHLRGQYGDTGREFVVADITATVVQQLRAGALDNR